MTRQGWALKKVIREWESEVENETQRLVEQGMPPYDAMEQATKNVSARRKQKSADSSGRQLTE